MKCSTAPVLPGQDSRWKGNKRGLCHGLFTSRALALRYALGLPGVSLAIVGMDTPEQVDEMAPLPPRTGRWTPTKRKGSARARCHATTPASRLVAWLTAPVMIATAEDKSGAFATAGTDMVHWRVWRHALSRHRWQDRS